MRSCLVLIHNIPAGRLTETDDGEYVFRYLEEYALRQDNPPVSLTMPLRKDPYTSKHLFPFFFNMLSEGENRIIQSRLLGINPEDDFGIMLATAHTDTIGAVTIKPSQS